MDLTWATESITIFSIVKGIDDEVYYLNPDHQRSIVHNTQWMRAIIDSIFNIGVLPPTLWHTTGPNRYESLDGKQRISAIKMYYDNTYKWNNKYYKELPQKERIFIDNFKLVVIRCTTRLSNPQIADLFTKLQENRRTTAGEMLNSNLQSPIKQKIDKTLVEKRNLFERLYDFDNKKEFKGEGDRNDNEELLFQLLYVFKYNNNTSLSSNKITGFLNNPKRDDDYCDDDIDDTIEMLNVLVGVFRNAYKEDERLGKDKEFKHMYSKSTLLPFVIFLREDFHNGYVDNINNKCRYLVKNMKNIFDYLWGGGILSTQSYKTNLARAERIASDFIKKSRA
jgi:hypothetical protein